MSDVMKAKRMPHYHKNFTIQGFQNVTPTHSNFQDCKSLFPLERFTLRLIARRR
jgi:hypothetical protein